MDTTVKIPENILRVYHLETLNMLNDGAKLYREYPQYKRLELYFKKMIETVNIIATNPVMKDNLDRVEVVDLVEKTVRAHFDLLNSVLETERKKEEKVKEREFKKMMSVVEDEVDKSIEVCQRIKEDLVDEVESI